ncbi:MAG: phosphotransferase family protein [Nitrososphaerales archaeon]
MTKLSPTIGYKAKKRVDYVTKSQVPTLRQVEKYLEQVLQRRGVKVNYFGRLDEYDNGKANQNPDRSIKTLGYGVPYLVVYSARGKKKQQESIVSTMRVGKGFGHDYRADRIDNIILSFDTSTGLPQLGKIQDFGALSKKDSSMISLGQSGEFFLLREKVSGVEYYKDLDRIFSSGELGFHDKHRAIALAHYLAKVHARKNVKDEELYVRKIRDTLGHGECIFGLADSYPRGKLDYLASGELEALEKKCVEHRWRLKNNPTRLSQVHGDFHPWNILFSESKKAPLKFRLLDRSRGEWGEPADDVCALSINYIFYSLRKYGRLDGPFKSLYNSFIETYLTDSGDNGILETMPLFYTFRALVISSPLWYPSLSAETRRQIFNFAENSLAEEKFDPLKINDYASKRPK